MLSFEKARDIKRYKHQLNFDVVKSFQSAHLASMGYIRDNQIKQALFRTLHYMCARVHYRY